MKRADLLSKRKKEIDNRTTLALTYHPALTKVYDILQKANRHTSKLKTTYEKTGVTICERKNCEVYHILHQGDTFEISNTGTQCKINFTFNCNSTNVIYLLMCKICGKQFVGSTVSLEVDSTSINTR